MTSQLKSPRTAEAMRTPMTQMDGNLASHLFQKRLDMYVLDLIRHEYRWASTTVTLIWRT